MAKKEIVKLKSNSIRAIVVAFSIFLLAAAFGSFGLYELPGNFGSLILTLTAVSVIFLEVGLVNIFSKTPKLDLLSGIGVTTALILLSTVVLEMFGITVATLEGIRGLAFLVVGGSFLFETFVR